MLSINLAYTNCIYISEEIFEEGGAHGEDLIFLTTISKKGIGCAILILKKQAYDSSEGLILCAFYRVICSCA